MERISVIPVLVSILIIGIISLSVQNAFSHGNVDQETSPFFSGLNSGVGSNFIKGQVFVPTVDNLIAVDVALAGAPLGVGDTIDFTIHQGTDSFNVPGIEFDRIGTISNIDGETFHLDLDSPVPLIPGDPHILELVTDDANFLTWRGTNFNSYADGKFVFCNISLNLCDDRELFDHSFRTYFEDEPSAIEVGIDIKPGSDPSSVNCKNLKGNVPVAIFGAGNFDATTIDIEIVSMNLVGLDPIQVFEVHDKLHIENLSDVGFDDAVLHLDKAEVCTATATAPLKETVVVELTGETTDGTQFIGIGDIKIVKR